MSQIENKMDDFMPFGGEIRSKYPEDDETVQHAIIDACFAALDDMLNCRTASRFPRISTQSVPELLETMADRFGIEPEERTLNANRAQAEECIRTGVPDIQVEIDCTNDDNFIEGTVTVEGESCYFYRPNNSRDTEDYDSVILEPFRPDGFEGDIEEIELPAAIDQNRELAELVVSVATEPYMDPDKAVGREQSIDSLCDEKTEVSESMRYGMEGVGLPMLDASEHLANY